MIPKKLHYCWFSGEPFPEEIERCINSWKKFLPDFEWIKWDREKALATNIPWVTEALQQKHWAFASDAVRLHALYTEGGLYLDTDVEILKPFDDLLKHPYFFGYENGSKRIEGAVMGCEPGCEPIAAALKYYKSHPFSYSAGVVDQMVLPNILRESFKDFKDLQIMPESVFSPKSFIDGKIRSTAETYSIHHFSSSWRPESLRRGIHRRQRLFATFPRPLARIFTIPLSLWTNITAIGVRGTIRKILRLPF